ncbi:hypothetical protein K493DRAFT_312492 [Basidiobolus meristosporus CBS 931.73]|uniref:HAUS augmin-like complex subunit 3 N-terminal domain-containing protein n=1 Tax=Basidiobolus meristosporus CBS 931.73 TaxID=1314790 RepID=A0A1Y1YUS1_9FUNG|nr:hypothetical protein K493DRAFT_312492 [Basidiobolus meristosporus CBS 931.73]|eukprot:ORY01315.1 hypothetical protein K493DRAFT_312492 [Basidiobolus meristosporus CBS 931.73]
MATTVGEFIEFLEQAGYPDAAGIDSKQIEWAFEANETASFMEWLHKNIDIETNVLLPEELEEYQRLEQTGKIPRFTEEYTPEEVELPTRAIMKEISSDCRKAVNRQQDYSNQLEKRSTLLSSNLEELESRLDSLLQAESEIDKQLEHQEGLLKNESSKMNHTLSDIEKSVNSLISDISHDRGDEPHTSLSQELGSARKMTKQCKSFDSEFIKLVGQLFNKAEGVSYYGQNLEEVLDIVDSLTEEFIQGDKLQIEDVLTEAERLVSMYPSLDKRFLECRVEYEKGQETLRTLEEENLRLDVYGNDMLMLKHEIENFKDATIEIESSLYDDQAEISDLYDELAASKVKYPLLNTHYQSISTRQKFIEPKLEKMVELLVDQNSREQLMSMVSEFEMDQFMLRYNTLVALSDELDTKLEEVQARQHARTEKDSKTVARTDIMDSRDSYLHLLNRMVENQKVVDGDDNATTALFTSYDSLKTKLEEFAAQISALKSELAHCKEDVDHTVANSERAETLLRQTVYRDSCTEQILLDSKEVFEQQSEFKKKIAELKVHYKKCKEATHMDDMLFNQKGIFEWFFLKPHKLEKYIELLRKQKNESQD